MSPRPDALVIGAGVVGASCAWHLVAAGLRVRVLEAGRAGAGATAAGMGHMVAMDDSEAQLALTRYSLALLDDLATSLPPWVELSRCGTLWLAEDADQMALVREKQARYRAHGVNAEVLDDVALAAAEPALRPGMAGALFVPGDAVVYPPGLTRWLLESAQNAGARVDEGVEVERIEEGGVRVAGQRLEAGLVVNAAGVGAARLTPALPILPRKGHLVVTERYPGLCRHQLVELGYLRSAHTLEARSVAFNLQPRPGGQLLVGSSRELVGLDAAVDRSVVRDMLARATRFLPPLARVLATRIWTGFRPATPDKLPLIGRWPEAERLWLAAGHEGLGITTALATGRLLAELVTGRTPAIDPSPYDPARVLEAA